MVSCLSKSAALELGANAGTGQARIDFLTGFWRVLVGYEL